MRKSSNKSWWAALPSRVAARRGGSRGAFSLPRERCRTRAEDRARWCGAGQRTFFWRRAMVVSVIAGLGAMAWLATGRLVSAAGAQAPQSQRCLSGGVPGEGQTAGSCGQVYVARPGDTIWSIAVAYSRGGDPRPLVDKFGIRDRGRALQPGERLIVP